jgi:hypothetical protein
LTALLALFDLDATLFLTDDPLRVIVDDMEGIVRALVNSTG